MLASRRATWPKIARIRAHCMVEMELDRGRKQHLCCGKKLLISPSPSAGVQYLRRELHNEALIEDNLSCYSNDSSHHNSYNNLPRDHRSSSVCNDNTENDSITHRQQGLKK